MVSADRSFAAETLRDGTANLNEPVYTSSPFGNFVRGYYEGSNPRSIVDGVMDARCGLTTFEDDPGGDPFIDGATGDWLYQHQEGRFITEARATFKINSSASNYLRNSYLWLITGPVGDDAFSLGAQRTLTTDPWNVRVNEVDSGVTLPQNTDEAEITLYFSDTDLRYVVTVAAIDILDVTIGATGRPEEMECRTGGTISRSLSPGGGSPATGYAYGSVNQISYTLTPYIITTTLPSGNVDVPYVSAVLVDGDPGVYTVTEGTIPLGLTLDPDTGEIAGTPTFAGVYTFTVTFTETDSEEVTEHEYSVEIVGDDPPVSILPAWKATLHGATVCGGDCSDDPTVVACLKSPPAGIGVPPQRVEDATYPQRDGVEHFSDWYEPRILTFEATVGNTTGGCGCEGGARTNAAELMDAWSRSCGDTELALFTDCPISTTAGAEYLRTDLATNQALNPSFEVANTDHWTGYPNDVLTTVSPGWVGDYAGSVVYADGPGDENAGALYGEVNTDSIAVTEGDPISASVRIKGTTGQNYTLGFLFYDVGGGFLTDVEGSPQAIDTVDWQKLTVSTTVPSAATQVLVVARATAAPPEDSEFLIDGLIVTFTATDVTYFDGSFPSSIDPVTGGIGYEWTGTANDSTSVMYDNVPSSGRGLTGPFGVIGRPRVAELAWRRGKKHIADALLRFDAVDHRLYILDEDGTPGSGAQCVTQTNGPSIPEYANELTNSPADMDHHWPLDFPHTTTAPVDATVQSKFEDVIGTADNAVGSPLGTIAEVQPTAPISFALSMSAVAPAARIQLYTSGTTPFPSGYTQGILAWWQQTEVDTDLPGVVVDTGTNNFYLGMDAGVITDTVQWGGSIVPLNDDVLDAMGFTDTYRGQPVFIMLAWDVTNLWIYTATPDSPTATLKMNIGAGGLPDYNQAWTLSALGGKISNISTQANRDTDDNLDVAEAISTPGFATPDALMDMPDVGSLCSPIQARFTGNWGVGVPVYIFREDGTFVGFPVSETIDQLPSSLDTATGTGRRMSEILNATNRITGNPFLEFAPGENLYVFGGGSDTSVEICYRPAVIST